MVNRSNLLQLILTSVTSNSRCQGNEIFKCAFKIQMDKTKMFQDVYSLKPYYSKKNPVLTRSSLNITITAIYGTFLQAKCLQVYVIQQSIKKNS